MANEYIEKALFYKDKQNNMDLALKYAYIAAASTYTPRADVCCIIGEIYLIRNELHWAKTWYENALYNMSLDFDESVIDQDYYTIIPLLKLGFITHKLNLDNEAEDYFEAVLKIQPDNEIALENIEEVRKKLNKLPS